jgi:hypothetical protein
VSGMSASEAMSVVIETVASLDKEEIVELGARRVLYCTLLISLSVSARDDVKKAGGAGWTLLFATSD